MRESPLFFIDIPFEERLKQIISNYGLFEKEELVNSIERIQKRLGGLETKNAINYLKENNLTECFQFCFTIMINCMKKVLITAKI